MLAKRSGRGAPTWVKPMFIKVVPLGRNRADGCRFEHLEGPGAAAQGREVGLAAAYFENILELETLRNTTGM